MAASVLLLAVSATVTSAQLPTFCTQADASQNGSRIQHFGDACLPDNEGCIEWMNAHCIGDGNCACRSGQCNIAGQCVDVGQCSTLTEGTCNAESCHAWRNATCTGGAEKQCVCRPGSCPLDGECRPPGSCALKTGGTCNVLGCNGWRGATCLDGLCMCGAEACPTSGECVPKGHCPRYANSACTIYEATGLLPCDVGVCEKGWCMCPQGECFADGACQEATAENVRLSLEWGKSQGNSRAVQEGATARATAAGAFGVAATVAFGLRAASVWRAKAGADRYEQLQD